MEKRLFAPSHDVETAHPDGVVALLRALKQSMDEEPGSYFGPPVAGRPGTYRRTKTTGLVEVDQGDDVPSSGADISGQ